MPVQRNQAIEIADVGPLSGRDPDLTSQPPCQPGVPSHRSRLREATQDVHARLDTLFSKGLHDTAALLRYLTGMEGFLQALSGALAPFLPAHAALRAWVAQLQRAVSDDLRQAGLRPLPAPSLVLANARQVTGAQYVLEGSALGASVLATGLAGVPGRFLSALSSASPRWRSFLAALDAEPLDAADDLAQGARAAFAAAEQAFSNAFRASFPDCPCPHP